MKCKRSPEQRRKAMNKRPYVYDEDAKLLSLRDPMILLDGDTYYLILLRNS